jgi:YHS domain-containing protein
MRFTRLLSALGLFGVLVLVTWLSGCGQGAAPPAGASSPSAPVAAPVEGDPAAGLAELDAADRKLAEKQKVCPVSGEALGSMGKPYKVTVKGRTFFLCCKGCLEELNANPDKFLKKLPK